MNSLAKRLSTIMMKSMVDYYLDDEGTLHVLIDGNEIGTERDCANLSEQALHDIAYELLKEYGYL